VSRGALALGAEREGCASRSACARPRAPRNVGRAPAESGAVGYAKRESCSRPSAARVPAASRCPARRADDARSRTSRPRRMCSRPSPRSTPGPGTSRRSSVSPHVDDPQSDVVCRERLALHHHPPAGVAHQPMSKPGVWLFVHRVGVDGRGAARTCRIDPSGWRVSLTKLRRSARRRRRGCAGGGRRRAGPRRVPATGVRSPPPRQPEARRHG